MTSCNALVYEAIQRVYRNAVVNSDPVRHASGLPR